MKKSKVMVQRNVDMEKFCDVSIEKCTAYIDGDKNLSVVGVMNATGQSPITDYREVHLLAIDDKGDLMAKEYTNWSEFGFMQSFDFDLDLSEFEDAISEIRVYPAIG